MRTLRTILATGLTAVVAVGLAACGGSSQNGGSNGSGSDSSGAVTLKVGATPAPHAKILTYIRALNDGELDANFYQTVPYLENAEREFDYDFTAGAGIHLEPLAIFSNKHKSLSELPDGGTIAVISDASNQSRALELLAKQGLVQLPADGSDASVANVTTLKDFTFKEVEGPQLVRSLDDFDFAVINGNFAQEGGLNIADQALVIESPENNPAVNVLVWKTANDKQEAIDKLEQLLHSDKVKQYIEQTWTDGSVIPAF